MTTNRSQSDVVQAVWSLRGQSLSGVSLTREQGAEMAPVLIPFPSFNGGLNYTDAKQDTDPQFTQDAVNVEISDIGGLKRSAGHFLLETFTGGRSGKAMLVHPSLDFTAELILIDGAFMGVKGTGATTWTNQSLPVAPSWVGIANGEDLLITNGVNGIYKKAYGVASTSLIVDSPAGVTLANFAGRVWVGGPTTGAVYQAMGVYWSGASGLSTDWLGLGSGAELLISNNVVDDRVVAMRPISFDLMVILCQRTVWVATRTGDPYRPAEFQMRAQGVGCVTESTAQVTPAGVIFLSSDGVKVFDGNQVSPVSLQIDEVLLPLMSESIAAYSSAYQASRGRYWLFTPTETFSFDVQTARWLRYSFVANKAVTFSEQFSGLSWDEASDTWIAILGTWDDIAPGAGSESLILLDATKLHSQSETSNQYMNGITIVAEYELLQKDSGPVSSLFTTDRLFLRKIGSDPSFEIHLPDNQGVFALHTTKVLPHSSGQDALELGMYYTGKGAGALLKWTEPGLEVSHFALRGVVRSKRIGVL